MRQRRTTASKDYGLGRHVSQQAANGTTRGGSSPYRTTVHADASLRDICGISITVEQIAYTDQAVGQHHYSAPFLVISLDSNIFMFMKNEILKLLADGQTYDEIAETLGCSKSTVAYHASPSVREKSHDARLKNKRKSIRDLKRMFGGKCSLCEYDRCLTSLHFHHRNGDEKENTIATLICNRGKAAAYKEAKKCILICSNCHGEIEEKKRGTHEDL